MVILNSVVGNLDHLVQSIDTRDGISLVIHGGFNSPPKPVTSPFLELLDQIQTCGSELGLSLPHRSVGGVCDGNRLSAVGLPTVDSLGPCGGHLHSNAEYVMLDSLAERAMLVASLLFKYAAGKFRPPISEPQM